MDTSTLHRVTEDLAAYLSEATVGELGRQTDAGADVGDVYLRLVAHCLDVAGAVRGEMVRREECPVPRTRADLEAAASADGELGLDAAYRKAARLMEGAFATATEDDRLYRLPHAGAFLLRELYGNQVIEGVVRTTEIAGALGFSYRPVPGVAPMVLRALAEAARSASAGAVG